MAADVKPGVGMEEGTVEYCHLNRSLNGGGRDDTVQQHVNSSQLPLQWNSSWRVDDRQAKPVCQAIQGECSACYTFQLLRRSELATARRPNLGGGGALRAAQ